MNLVFGFLVLVSGIGIVVWHMVRPNFRDLRISVAEFLPDFEQSQARRTRISLAAPLRSVAFMTRLAILATMIAALWSHLLPPPPMSMAGADAHLRIVLDGSPSMTLATRVADARHAVGRLTSHMNEVQDGACVDLVDVTTAPRIVPRTAVADRLATPSPATDGVRATALLGALALDLANPECPGPVTHAAFVTDIPRMLVPPTVFDGPVVWWQIGDPLENVALEEVRLSGGGLTGATPTIDISARKYGGEGTPPKLALTKDATRVEIEMTPDISREHGWTAALPYPGAGTLSVELVDGGAFDGDDRLRVTLPALDRLSVDWQLPDLPRPAAFDQGGQTDLLVARFNPASNIPADRPVILLYDGWERPSTSADIGAFIQDHPLLELVNFDVLEPRLPLGLTTLPDGFEAVLLDNSQGGRAIIAARTAPPGVLAPAPSFADPDTRALSLTLLGNALGFALAPGGEPSTAATRPHTVRLAASGDEIRDPLHESDTNRALTEAPDLAPLSSAARAQTSARLKERDINWVPWLMLLAALALLAERAVSLRWRSPA